MDQTTTSGIIAFYQVCGLAADGSHDEVYFKPDQKEYALQRYARMKLTHTHVSMFAMIEQFPEAE